MLEPGSQSTPLNSQHPASKQVSSVQSSMRGRGGNANRGTGAGDGGRRNQRQGADGSLNHLLGFTLPPRQRPSASPRRGKRNAAHAATFSKDRFVHAQYRFLLKPTGDFTAHFADPDIHFHWPDVLQVIVPISTALPSSNSPLESDSPMSAHSKPLCPICLSKPSAPRMTKCGHIFCYPCLLHYLELGDEGRGQGRRCPVCWDTVLRKDVKSVQWFDAAIEELSHRASSNWSPPADVVNDDDCSLGRPTLTFRLIQRPDITTLALPRSSTWPSDAVPLHRTPWHFTPDAFVFAKFLQAAPDYILSSLEQDLVELRAETAALLQWGSGSHEDLGVTFVKAAEVKVREQMQKCLTLKTQPVMTARRQSMRDISLAQEHGNTRRQATSASQADTVKDSSAPATNEEAGHAAVEAYISTRTPFSDRFAQQRGANSIASPVTSITTDSSSPTARGKPRRNVNPPAPADATYFFYQAASGQQIYLHPLDIRILKSHFGSYERFPDTLTLPIEGHEDGSMNEDLRKRCRYLSHLPTGCDIVFVEADLEPLVGSRGIGSYAQALRQRRNKRKDKAKREDKAKAKSEQRERDEMAARYSEHHLLPGTTAMSNTVRASPASILEDVAVPSYSTATAPDSTTLAVPQAIAGRPAGRQATGARTVWGTEAIATSTLTGSAQLRNPAMDDFDDAWAEFEDDVVLNGSQRKTTGRGRNGGGGQVAPGGGPSGSSTGRKTKKKKVVLSLTGGGRGA